MAEYDYKKLGYDLVSVQYPATDKCLTHHISTTLWWWKYGGGPCAEMEYACCQWWNLCSSDTSEIIALCIRDMDASAICSIF